jgi:putative component of toxin-antitoxin plasmid stabilization module
LRSASISIAAAAAHSHFGLNNCTARLPKKVAVALYRLAGGNFSNVKGVGSGVFE